MKKYWLAAALGIFIVAAVPAQTLFTYGGHKADAKEFLRAFSKNNPEPASAGRPKALREYLDLYINSRLKITEAYERRYDTLPQIKSEVDNLRNQIIENYMSDPETITRLSNEAFQRSLKDIHGAYIFISYNNAGGDYDTVAANKKLAEVMRHLQKAEDFLQVAKQFSDEPGAAAKGDLSWVTVFSLPYEYENALYSTAVGKYSAPLRSKSGYFIFKNLGERKAIGKVKGQQILIAFPPEATDADKKRCAALADSLYRRVMAGDDFGKLAAKFSNDYISAASNGNMQDISVGQYAPAFEKAIWALPVDGVSKPFVTTHGYHIVKKLAVKPVVTSAANKENMDALRQRIMQDDRWKTAKDFIYNAVKSKAGFKHEPYNESILWRFSDSLLDRKPAGTGNVLSIETPLFTIGDSTLTVAQWVQYAQSYRYKPDRSGIKPYPELMDEFVKHTLYQYYRDHLEDYNAEFRNQMAEFRDGNLFFEIMQQEVWNKAQSDSVALMQLFEKQNQDYHWKQSADAVIFFCSDSTTASALLAQLKKNPAGWKASTAQMSDKVVADSGRYEWSQLPGLTKSTPVAKTFTSPTVNPADNTSSFAYIMNVYTGTSPRTFNEAKGLVMNDYQALLEKQWIESLKKKYPVTIDEKVFSTLGGEQRSK